MFCIERQRVKAASLMIEQKRGDETTRREFSGIESRIVRSRKRARARFQLYWRPVAREAERRLRTSDTRDYNCRVVARAAFRLCLDSVRETFARLAYAYGDE